MTTTTQNERAVTQQQSNDEPPPVVPEGLAEDLEEFEWTLARVVPHYEALNHVDHSVDWREAAEKGGDPIW